MARAGRTLGTADVREMAIDAVFAAAATRVARPREDKSACMGSEGITTAMLPAIGKRRECRRLLRAFPDDRR